MKVNLVKWTSSVVVETEDERFMAQISIETGEVLNFTHEEITIDELYRFVNKARSSYRKFLQSAEVESFKFD
jgi:hypothetical protein